MNKPPETIYEPGKSWGDDPNAQINHDLGGCGQGCASALITLTLVIVFVALAIWSHAATPPGTVITLYATSSLSTDVAHRNLFVSNGRPPAYVCSADVRTPGQPIKWLVLGQQMSGTWLLGGMIGLPDGSIVSDACLPRLPQSSDSSGQLIPIFPPGENGGSPPLPVYPPGEVTP